MPVRVGVEVSWFADKFDELEVSGTVAAVSGWRDVAASRTAADPTTSMIVSISWHPPWPLLS